MKKILKHFWVFAFCMAAISASAQPFITSSVAHKNINSPVATAATTTIHSGDILAYQYFTPPTSQTAVPIAAQEETFSLNVASVTGLKNSDGTFTYPNAGSWTWSTVGDVRIVGANGQPVQSITGVTSVTVFNYNNQLSGYPLDLGQSKGRIILTWTYTNQCNNQGYFSFDLDKMFNNAANAAVIPPISTTTPCLMPFTSYSFVVNSIVTDNIVPFNGVPMDEYSWVPIGGSPVTSTVYTSDHSSVTFTTGAVPPTSLQCYFGRANGANYPGSTQWQTTTASQAFSTLNFGAGNSVVPVFTVSAGGSPLGGNTSCLPLTTTHTLSAPYTASSPYTISISNPQAGCTYSWSYGTDVNNNPNGWTTAQLQSGAAPYATLGQIVSGAPSITFLNLNNQPGIVKLTVTDQCGHPNIYPFTVYRVDPYWTAPITTAPEYQSLVTLNKTCVQPGDLITATVPTTGLTAANLNNFTWYLPTGWSVTPVAGGASYTITVPAGTPPNAYTIYAGLSATGSSSSCYINPGTINNGAIPFTISVRPTSVTVTPATSTCVQVGSSIALAATPNNFGNGASGEYIWTSSDGYALPVQGGTEVTTYKYGGNGLSAVTITAKYIPGTDLTCFTPGTAIITPQPPTTVIASSKACLKSTDAGETVTISSPTPSYGDGTYSLTFYNPNPNFTDILNDKQTYKPDASGNITIPFATGFNPATGGDAAYFVRYGGCPGIGIGGVFTVGVPPQSISIGGTTTCMATGTTSTLTGSPAACTNCAYTWTATSGSVSPTTGNPTVFTSGATASTITATYKTISGCTASNSVTTVPTPSGGVAPAIQVATCTGNVANATTSIKIGSYTATAGVNYTLNYQSGVKNVSLVNNVIPNPDGTIPLNTIVADATNPMGAVTGAGVYTLTMNSTCVNGSVTSLPFTIDNTPPYKVSYDTYASTPAAPVLVAVPNVAGTVFTYTWYNSTAGKILQPCVNCGSNIDELSVAAAGANNYFGAVAQLPQSAGGCYYISNFLQPGFSARPTANGALPSEVGTVYPNPNQGIFVVNLLTVTDKASGTLYDINGRAVLEMNFVQGENRLSGATLANGNYILVTIVDGQTYTNQIVVAKQ